MELGRFHQVQIPCKSAPGGTKMVPSGAVTVFSCGVESIGVCTAASRPHRSHRRAMLWSPLLTCRGWQWRKPLFNRLIINKTGVTANISSRSVLCRTTELSFRPNSSRRVPWRTAMSRFRQMSALWEKNVFRHCNRHRDSQRYFFQIVK